MCLLLASLSEKIQDLALYTMSCIPYCPLWISSTSWDIWSFVPVQFCSCPLPIQVCVDCYNYSVLFISRIQANQTGQRLQHLNIKYTKLVCSTLIRAIETADIIAQHLPNVPRETCDLLREGAPIVPEPPSSSNWRPAKRVSSSKPGPGCSNIG